MCGLFGAIGNPKKIDWSIVAQLAILNRDRGNHAMGFFFSDGEHWKKAGDPYDLLAEGEVKKVLARKAGREWFVAGHTRQSTCANASKDECAHPFVQGDYILAHNGIVRPPYGKDEPSYEVDSQYLLDRLVKAEGAPQKAFGDVDGWWALTWRNPLGQLFLHAAETSQIHETNIAGVTYYSSAVNHLRCATGMPTDRCFVIQKGHCWFWSPKKPSKARYLCQVKVKAKKVTHFYSGGKSGADSGTVSHNPYGYSGYDYRDEDFLYRGDSYINPGRSRSTPGYGDHYVSERCFVTIDGLTIRNDANEGEEPCWRVIWDRSLSAAMNQGLYGPPALSAISAAREYRILRREVLDRQKKDQQPVPAEIVDAEVVEETKKTELIAADAPNPGMFHV
jgi:hypothetical protein